MQQKGEFALLINRIFHIWTSVVCLSLIHILGCLLKGENDTLTLRLSGGGPVGSIIAVADSTGSVKAYPANPVVELPLNDKGKLDVAGAVGTDGYLSVIRDLGLKEPYICLLYTSRCV